MGRRHLGDVHRGNNQRRADAEAADHARQYEREKVGRHRRGHRRDRKQDGRDLEHKAAADAVTQGTRKQHAQRRGQRQRGHGPAELDLGQPEFNLDGSDRTGNDGRVESHQETAQRDNESRDGRIACAR